MNRHEQLLPTRLMQVLHRSIWSHSNLRVVDSGKLRRAIDGPVRGGDWVLIEKSGGTTLSIGFENEGKEFGLTTGARSMLEDPRPHTDSDVGSP